jgi:hypothetical protein
MAMAKRNPNLIPKKRLSLPKEAGGLTGSYRAGKQAAKKRRMGDPSPSGSAKPGKKSVAARLESPRPRDKAFSAGFAAGMEAARNKKRAKDPTPGRAPGR